METMRARRAGRAWLAAVLAVLLGACGGDGGDDESPVDATGAPVIVTQPVSASVGEGERAEFEVAASGTAPLSYQWQRDGQDIEGATAEQYTTPALAAADDGAVFRVVVSNAEGSVTSSDAALSVTAAAGDGTLTLSGPGVEAVGAGTRYAPVSAMAVPQGPTCSGGRCGSILQLIWSQGPGDQLMVMLVSSGIAEPGATPGTQLNGVSIALSSGSFGSMGLNYVCVADGCDPAARGITLDLEARTLRFADTRVPAYDGGPDVVLDGTLHY